MDKLAPASIAIVLIVATPATVGADPVDLPHSFQSGVSASAAEVNANFDAVKTAVDDNAADIAALGQGAAAIEAEITELQQSAAATISGVLVAVAGAPVGTLLSVNPRVGRPSDPNAPDPDANVLYPASIFDTPALWILNGRGYVAQIVVAPEYGPELMTPPAQGQLWPGALSYADSACLTAPYVGVVESRERPPAGAGQLLPFPSAWFSSTNGGDGGWVFRSPDPTDPIQTYMASVAQPTEDATLVAWKVPSRTNDGADCIEFQTPLTVQARRVSPNDPAVSGIPNDLVGRVTLLTN